VAEKPTSTIAVIALFVSISTAGFSFFQWWNSEREARINAAIEISRTFNNRPPLTKEEDDTPPVPGGQLSPAQATFLMRIVDRSDYIAYLVNHRRVDFDYLSANVKCGLFAAYKEFAQQKATHKIDLTFTDLERFSARVESICSPLVLPGSK
jgi:hypothetical protein